MKYSSNFLHIFQTKSEKIRKFAELMYFIRENFNIFEVYGLDKHISSIGLVVNNIYRRRGIAEHLLRCRIPICMEFGIKMTSTVFTSDSSNRVADRVGFKLDKLVRYSKNALKICFLFLILNLFIDIKISVTHILTSISHKLKAMRWLLNQ